MIHKLTQQELAIKEGYTECFVFADGHVYCKLIPEKCYPIASIEKQPCPCTITETVVYRIKTTDGIKGIAVISFEQDECY